MNKWIPVLAITLSILLVNEGQAQSVNGDLIKLAKVYRDFLWINPPLQTFEQLNSIDNPQLKASKDFILEAVKPNNKITSALYLNRPDSITIKNLFIIRSINWNLHEADPIDNLALIDSLNLLPPSSYEQLSSYYEMIFVSVSNKNKPFNMSKVNFNIDSYGLKDDTEKGIFFLEAMQCFGTFIWGYMNIPTPPKYDKALDVIENYPTFNSQPYYQFQDLNFKDFILTTDKRKPKESFKKYYINKYMETILYHATCLSQSKRTKAKAQEVLIQSILRNESYYKYSEHPEAFEQIFQRIK
ncbi:MAG TPA: hypothetical protein VK666_12460 [Chryseolinea sp.]|nr:hypothetical protein [Chryseolinea sp.]